MDGFHTFDEISAETGTSPAGVLELFESLRGEKLLGTLEEWNQCFWCTSCRVYLSHARECPECGSSTWQVPWLPPCDPWILYAEEHEFVARALQDHAGIVVDPDRLLLATNGVQHNCFFWQVACDGEIVLRVDFRGTDPASWQFTVTNAASRVNWQRKSSGRHAEIERTVAANRAALQFLEEEAIAFLDEVSEYYPTDPLLYFSGGKESVVMLRLLEKAGLKANLAFVGTGLDFPEDAQFLLEELKPLIDRNPLFRLETNMASPELFLDAFQTQGRRLEARSAWCRERIKVPLKRAITEKFYGDQHFIALEGSRWYENDFRRSHPRVNFARGYERQIWVHPIAPWTGLDVWLYIHSEHLKINPMYQKGYQRTTCWMCPIVNPFHINLSKRQYPELWKSMEGIELIGFDHGDNLNTPF
jgi:3'-phosphoadenosine 5'-phosphosulfate sulfotransferase (PAPS reductase)/FAD synthetase